MNEIDRAYGWTWQHAFREMIKSRRMTRLVTVTVDPRNKMNSGLKTASAVGRKVQRYVEQNCAGTVIGAAEIPRYRDPKYDHPHWHGFAGPKDARRLKDAIEASGIGFVDIERPDDDPEHYDHAIDYVRRKWDGSTSSGSVMHKLSNTSRGV